MEIKLIRTEMTPEHTLGVLENEDGFFGYTIEPVDASMGVFDAVTALPKGSYAMIVRNNPIAGTPCIKLIGSDVPANASMRCCLPKNAKNPSITLVSSKKNDGDYKNADFEAWTKLLAFIVKHKTVTLVIQ